jgi:ribosomal protein L10
MPEVELVTFDPESTEVTFRYDLAKLITGYNPKKPPTEDAIIKRLEDLLRAASNGTFSLKPPATIAKDKMQAIEIKVGVLDCKGCRYGAYIAIAKLDGVDRATVSNSGVLTAWIDSAKTNREALEAALKKARVELPAP